MEVRSPTAPTKDPPPNLRSTRALCGLRVLGDCYILTLKLRWIYARAIYEDDCATLDDLREAVTTLEETERIARRVLGGAHPIAAEIEDDLQDAREVLELRSKIA